MLRVGFILQANAAGWLGGLNYFRNLLQAVWKLPDRRIEPVILTEPSTPASLLNGFPAVEVLRHPLFQKHTPSWLLRESVRRLRMGEPLLQAFLLRHGIGLLSHSEPLGPHSLVPTLGWIADFQHRHLPELFTSAELETRDRLYRRMCKQCTCMLVSSKNAQRDLEEFAPGTRSELLRFVCHPPRAESSESPTELLQRYSLAAPFFLLPNQFWAHKNHQVVLRALHKLRLQGRRVLVAATGSSEDYRKAGYFAQIENLASELAVTDQFKFLGRIPFADLVGLMRACLAFIQPSLFEGWSTSVEEAKSLGKRIVLSNIPVHLEQDPPGALFFDPHKPEQLARCLLELQDAPDRAEVAEKLKSDAAAAQETRFREFGRRYQTIALETCRSEGSWSRLLRRVLAVR